MGLVVLGPDVNESRAMFTPILRREVEESRSRAANPSGSSASRPLDSSTGQPAAAIRFGLAGVKGVGELAAQKIIEEREKKRGRFADFPDFVQRVDGRAINKRVLEHLVKTGAFDFSGAARKSLFDSIDAALAGAAAQARDKAAGQHSFMDMLADEAPAQNGHGAAAPSPRITTVAANGEFSAAERLAFEKELLGFYVTGHPMKITRAGRRDRHLRDRGDAPAGRPHRVPPLRHRQQPREETLEARQPPLGRVHPRDQAGRGALNMFADAYAAYGTALAENALVLVQGQHPRQPGGRAPST